MRNIALLLACLGQMMQGIIGTHNPPTPPPPVGTSYYIATAGSDSNNGLTTGTPWKTIAHAQSTLTGDQHDVNVLFNQGDTWREAYSVPAYGTSGHPFTIGVYGSGAAPIINASVLLTSWTIEGSIYYASVGAQPTQVFRDNARLTLAASKSALVTGQWWWDSGNSRVYVYDNPSGHTIEETPPGTIGLAVYGKNYISINGLRVTKANNSFWFFGGSTYITCTGCLTDWNSNFGIGVTNSAANVQILNAVSHDNIGHAVSVSGATNNVLVSGGEMYNNPASVPGSAGVAVDAYAANTTVTGVYSHGNYYGLKAYGANGAPPYTVFSANNTSANFVDIDVDYTAGAAGIVVEKNTCSSSAAGGYNIMVEGDASGVTVRYNKVTGGAIAGIWFTAPNDTAYGNVVYNASESYGVWGTGALLYNNTSYGGAVSFDIQAASATLRNNIAVSPSYRAVRVAAGSTSGFTSDYNDWDVGSSSIMQWGSTAYNFANWKTNSGQDAHSINADPLFTNAGASQFWLQAGSPGIGAGIALGSPYNMLLSSSSTWPGGVVLEPANTPPDLGAYVF